MCGAVLSDDRQRAERVSGHGSRASLPHALYLHVPKAGGITVRDLAGQHTPSKYNVIFNWRLVVLYLASLAEWPSLAGVLPHAGAHIGGGPEFQHFPWATTRRKICDMAAGADSAFGPTPANCTGLPNWHSTSMLCTQRVSNLPRRAHPAPSCTTHQHTSLARPRVLIIFYPVLVSVPSTRLTLGRRRVSHRVLGVPLS